MSLALKAGQEFPDLLLPEQRAAIFGGSRADLITLDQRRTIFGDMHKSKSSRPRSVAHADQVSIEPEIIQTKNQQRAELEAERRRFKWEGRIRLTLKAMEVAAKIVLELFVTIMGTILLAPLLRRERHH